MPIGIATILAAAILLGALGVTALVVLWAVDRHTARSEPGHQFGGRR